MQKLALHKGELLRGTFDLKKLNFLFVFQVNCPGCFLYGIPLVNKLYNEFGNQMSFLGMSTAFEDFEYNTTENTKALLFKKEVVGETKKALENQGLLEYPMEIDFPVAMDARADTSFDYEAGADTICNINPNYSIWPEFEKKALKNKVIKYLKNQEVLSLTFTLNQMKGTPTMLVFNEQYEILFSKFGHVDYLQMKQNMNDLIARFN